MPNRELSNASRAKSFQRDLNLEGCYTVRASLARQTEWRLIIKDMSPPPKISIRQFPLPFRPNLKTLHGDTHDLVSVITRTSELAESVSSKVRVLDLAKVSR